jgi:anti-sigma factor ChrR (cupin superfamily)
MLRETDAMELNADFTQRAIVHGAEIPWQLSPIVDIERRMLDRIGDEVARATTIVRYAPGSQFSPHTHGGGEEFLVLEGVFQDEFGDYPVGTYVRNPPTSSHTPYSEVGCVILVKLWQFDPNDRTQITIDTTQQIYVSDVGRSGVRSMPLFSDDRERVSLEYWEANTHINFSVVEGLELFVIEGSFWESNQEFKRYSWLRLPAGSSFSGRSEGCQVWRKQGKFRI